jgi:formylglycine-generating enzyme required for sulfatase activity
MTAPGATRASPDPVSKLIKLLAEERKNFTSVEIAETLWLAMQMEPAAEVVPDKPQLPTPLLTPSVSLLTGEEPELPPPLPTELTPRANIAAPIPQAGVLPPQTLPVWLADPAMLTDSLSVIRALKPLLQKVEVAAGVGKRLDEAATVDNIARTRLWLPILEPEQEPWFDIILVVDCGSSMHIWQRLVKDLVRILRHYGAFRDVRVFDLVVNQAVQSTGDAVQLISQPQRPGHRPSELIDQRGRRIAIVLSDCAGTYWWDGTLLPMLQDWGKIMPTVVWQMLPPWMWKRTALGRGIAVAISNDIPGVANQRLKTRVQERNEPDDAARRISVPVVTSDVRDLTCWSLMLAGDRREVTPGFLLPQQGGSIPRSKGIEAIARDRAQRTLDEGSDADPDAVFNQALETIARDRVQRFLELASPQAQRLIVLLAAAPVITLPVVRLIRDAMLYEAHSPLPVAEVFLSGLILRLPGQEDRELERVLQEESERAQAKLDRQDRAQPEENELERVQLDRQDLVQYDFVPKVREVLLAVLPAVDTIEVINSISAAVERRWNQFSQQDFRAFLTDPNVEVSKELTGLRSFASVTANILEQLGGEYASFARQLRYGHGEEPPPDGLKVESDDFPLEDLEYEVAEFINFPPLQDFEYEPVQITNILERFEFETAEVEKSREIRRQPAANWGYTESLSEEIALEMASIPGGSFIMGAPDGEPDSRDSERPQHEVTLPPFYLGRYLITQAQWRIVANWPQVERSLEPDPSHFKGDSRPVEQVSWEDAVEFCQRLSAKTGRAYRLPSEAEWEYACRAIKNEKLQIKNEELSQNPSYPPFHFGEIITADLANYNARETYNGSPKGEFRTETTDGGIFPANRWGLHDMHGNVFEWCEDDWHDSYEVAPEDGSAWLEANTTDTRKLLRGGCWNYNPGYCRSAFRGYHARDYRYDVVGFRVCCVLPRTLLNT